MANIIKKISAVDPSGDTIVADAAVTNIYTDESGDLNIKTSTELGDNADSKIIITSKEIDLNADIVNINSYVELTEYMSEDTILPSAKNYTYGNSIVPVCYEGGSTFNEFIVFKVNNNYIIFQSNYVHSEGVVPQMNGYKYLGTTNKDNTENSLYNTYIKALCGDTVPGEESSVYSDDKGLMTLEEKNTIASLKESIEGIQNQLQDIQDYLDEVDERLEVLES